MLIWNPQFHAALPEVAPVDTSSREQRIAAVEANKRWFEAARERLAKEYPASKYVAVWRGMPVLTGNDWFELGLEFCRHFGHQPVYIGNLSGQEDKAYVLSPVS